MLSKQGSYLNVGGRNNGFVWKTSPMLIKVQDIANQQYSEKRNQYVDTGPSLKAGSERQQKTL